MYSVIWVIPIYLEENDLPKNNAKWFWMTRMRTWSHGIYQILQCEIPNKNTYYFTIPALDGTSFLIKVIFKYCSFKFIDSFLGTHCALGECHGGECVPVNVPQYSSRYRDIDNWSEWKKNSCKSSCLKESKRVQVKRRTCEHLSQNNELHWTILRGPVRWFYTLYWKSQNYRRVYYHKMHRI
jgi:hypothetical protein